MNKCTRTCSPIMDMTTADVWRLFSYTDWNVSDMYEKLFDSGVAIENQRTASLLHVCAVKSVSSIKSLEPKLYDRINSRFNNVEFIASFGKSGYYNLSKPKDKIWSGREHIKAGMSEDEIEVISNKYLEILKKYGMYTIKEFENLTEKERNSKYLSSIGICGEMTKDYIFKFEDYYKDKFVSLAEITPLQLIIENFENTPELRSLNTIITSWKDYCLYMLNTSDEPAKSIWKDKLVTSILSLKYTEMSVYESTIDAVKILSNSDEALVSKITEDNWTNDDYHIGNVLPMSGKICLSLSHYPQESLEKECLGFIKYLLENREIFSKEYKTNMELKKFIDKYQLIDFNTMNSPKQSLICKYGDDSLKSKYKIKKEDSYSNLITYDDNLSNEYYNIWKDRILNSINLWFKENIHSTYSWKAFTIGIIKGDITMKYIGFPMTLQERIARTDALRMTKEINKD